MPTKRIIKRSCGWVSTRELYHFHSIRFKKNFEFEFGNVPKRLGIGLWTWKLLILTCCFNTWILNELNFLFWNASLKGSLLSFFFQLLNVFWFSFIIALINGGLLPSQLFCLFTFLFLANCWAFYGDSIGFIIQLIGLIFGLIIELIIGVLIGFLLGLLLSLLLGLLLILLLRLLFRL